MAQRNEDAYVARVNRAIDVVLSDLNGDLRLERLAAEAGFSPFHFHRIFRSVVGETLSAFVARVRLERAIRAMRHGTSSLTDVAIEAGFGSSSSFSRAFRQRYGVPPSAFDPATHLERSEASPPRRHEHLLDRAPVAFELDVRQLEARTVAYRRVTRPYEPGRLEQGLDELRQWVSTSDLRPSRWLGYSWDDPDIVDPARCRYDVAVEVAAGTPISGRIGRLDFGPTLVAEVAVSGSLDLEAQALDWLFGSWLPASGFLPAEAPTFEVWTSPPAEIDPEAIDLTIQLPIVRHDC